MANPELEEYEDEPKQKLKGSFFRKAGGYFAARKKQKAFEKQIYKREFQTALQKQRVYNNLNKQAKLILKAREQAKRKAMNEATGYGKVIGLKAYGGAKAVGKGAYIVGKKSAPIVKKIAKGLLKVAVKATD